MRNPCFLNAVATENRMKKNPVESGRIYEAKKLIT